MATRFGELPSAPLAVGAAVGLFTVHAALSKLMDGTPSSEANRFRPLSEDDVAVLCEKMAALIGPIVSRIQKSIFEEGAEIEEEVKGLFKISKEQHKRVLQFHIRRFIHMNFLLTRII
eukprot:SAG31_NODE_594_length_13670_cov_2.624642_2_plen_118_part_00